MIYVVWYVQIETEILNWKYWYSALLVWLVNFFRTLFFLFKGIQLFCHRTNRLIQFLLVKKFTNALRFIIALLFKLVRNLFISLNLDTQRHWNIVFFIVALGYIGFKFFKRYSCEFLEFFKLFLVRKTPQTLSILFKKHFNYKTNESNNYFVWIHWFISFS